MKRTRGAEWARRVARWQSSGLSCREFAEREGVNPSTLGWWKWRLSRQSGSASGSDRLPEEGSMFVELDVDASTAAAGPGGGASAIEVGVGDYYVAIRPGFDAATLSQVLEVLEGRR